MAVLKKISQEAFDEAVKENIETFDMTPEEALEAALTEFKLQGVDLGGIVKRAGAEDELSSGIKAAIDALQVPLDGPRAEGATTVDIPALAAAATSLQQLVEGHEQQGRLDEALAVGGTKGGITLLARGCSAAAVAGDSSAVEALLRALRCLSRSADNKKLFLRLGGPAAVQQAWDAAPGDWAVVEAACALLAEVCASCEDGKAVVVDSGLYEKVIGAGCLGRQGAPPGVLAAAAAVVTALTSADDLTASSSRAFPNARQLGREGAAKTLAGLIKGYAQAWDSSKGTEDVRAAAALCRALRGVSANDDICKEASEEGAVVAALQLLQKGMAIPVLASAAAALVRQLANNDAVKGGVIQAGGADVILEMLAAHEGNYEIAEQALGCMAVLTLRNPDAAEALLAAGAYERGLEVAGEALRQAAALPKAEEAAKKERAAAGAVVRQACLAARNGAVRSASVREALLGKGCAEQLAREGKAQFGGQAVREVATALLRDLGFDDYNE